MNEYEDFIIFATNFIENFAPAFMRRISTHIEFTLPDLDCWKKLWARYILPTMPNHNPKWEHFGYGLKKKQRVQLLSKASIRKGGFSEDYIRSRLKKSGRKPSARRTLINRIEEIPQIFEDKINETILNEESYKVALFAGGEFHLEYLDARNYSSSYKFYFQDRNDKPYEIAAKSEPLELARLSRDAQKTIKFEIPEPSEEVRKKVQAC